MLEKLFKDLQFSQKESAIYLAILELGQARAIDLAKKTGFNRTTVYDLLEVLIQKGLVSKFKKGATSFFNALEPERLINYLERDQAEYCVATKKKKQQVQELLPQLISLQNVLNAKPKIKLFEGEKGMREAYEDTLTAKNSIIAYANVETMHHGLPNFFPEYYQRRVQSKVFIRAILPRNKLSLERAQHDQVEMRATRFLPAGQIFSPEVNIYNNKMLVASWKEKMAVVIESKELADLQKIIFETLWQILPKH